MQKETFLVTGGNGFIASWIIKFLLQAGYTVNTTVRNINDISKTTHLQKMAENAEGRLTIFQADLLKDKDFELPMTGVSIVIHTASPFKTTGIKDPFKELINPALQGTKNILASASKSESVKKIILTSSVGAIWCDAIEAKDTLNGVFTEDNWNKISSPTYQPYPYSKMIAEKEAWKIADEQNQWKLIVINPAFVLGPSLSKASDSTSQQFIESYVKGTYKGGVPELYFGIADVREVAQAHIHAALKPNVEGRHIISGTIASMLEIGKSIEQVFPSKYKLPKNQLPKLLLYLSGPFIGFSWRYIKNNVGVNYRIDNSKSINRLNIEYRPLHETLKDQIMQLKEFNKEKSFA
jgi:nucleoside-diphosphate-sugar epimerase